MSKLFKCKKCRFWQFTTVLSSLDKPIWHCRFGFSPSSTCVEQGNFNLSIIDKNSVELDLF